MRGYAHDVVTDEDLDREGCELLAPYRVVITGSHPEYLSPAMMDAFEGYLGGGGRLMYLGGNGFYWQIAFHRHERGIIECRKSEGVRNFELEPGERHHSFDGRAGGLWRTRGRAPNRLVGVGTTAFGFDSCGHYLRTPESFDPRAAFIFDGLGDDEPIGDFGLVGGGAAGVEVDRYDRALGSPAHALVVARSAGLSRCYLPAPEEVPCLHPAMSGDENSEVRADMVFFEGPKGGAVFSTARSRGRPASVTAKVTTTCPVSPGTCCGVFSTRRLSPEANAPRPCKAGRQSVRTIPAGDAGRAGETDCFRRTTSAPAAAGHPSGCWWRAGRGGAGR